MNVLLYTDDFLTRSMTFIYGPLKRIAGMDGVNIRVACANRLNSELFPYPDVAVLPLTRPPDHPVNRVMRKLGISFTPADRRFEGALERYLREQRIDLVHVHFGPCALRVYPVAKKLAVPLLVTFHGYDASILLRKRVYVREIKQMMRDSAVYGLTVSANMRRVLAAHEINVERTVHHYNGIDTTFFDLSELKARKPSETFTFLQISNLIEKKGHRYTLTAFAQAIKTDTTTGTGNARLVLAGDGPLRRELQDLAKRLDLGDRVSFIGPVNHVQVRELLSEADVFVHHSVSATSGDQEGLPVAITEAMAMGLPILSTYHAAIPELVRDRQDGILLQERDVDGYAAAMRQAWQGKLDWHNPEDSRRRITDNFELSVHCRRLHELYRTLASRPQ